MGAELENQESPNEIQKEKSQISTNAAQAVIEVYSSPSTHNYDLYTNEPSHIDLEQADIYSSPKGKKIDKVENITSNEKENATVMAVSSSVSRESTILTKLAQPMMGPAEYPQFSQEMTKFEERIPQLQARFEKEGLSSDKAKLKAQELIAKTFEEISRLLAAKDNPNVPISINNRVQLAEEIMSNAATPSTIKQGQHSTCNVSTVEVRAYTREPAAAARMVLAIATTGKYTADDGTMVKLDQQSLQPDKEAESGTADKTRRNYASQLFQITAVNIHYAKTKPNIRYEQHKIDPSLVASDSGERLVDYSSSAPEEKNGLSRWERWINHKTDSRFHQPKLTADDLTEIYNTVTGTVEKNWMYVSSSKDKSDIYSSLIGLLPGTSYYNDSEKNGDTVQVSSAKDLQEKLTEAKDKGQLPVVILVHTGNEPFLSDSNGAKDWHTVSVVDIEPGAPPKIAIDNQWQEENDHISQNKLNATALYTAMKLPQD